MSTLRRVNATTLELDPPAGVPVRVIANADVPIDRPAIRELAAFASIVESTATVGGQVHEIVCTPDFHKGAGIPIGTVTSTSGAVIPAAVGNDVGCGMRLIATDLTAAELDGGFPDLARHARHVFFQGGRNTPLDADGRLLALTGGPGHLHDHLAEHDLGGLWSTSTPLLADARFAHTRHMNGTEPDPGLFRGWTQPERGEVSFDSVLGSIGGSNHFCEFQAVDEIMDPHVAWHLGLTPGTVCVMVHTGSVSLGHTCGAFGDTAATRNWPTGTTRPRGAVPLADHGPDASQWVSAVAAATTFAATNRWVLSLMAIEALRRSTGTAVEGRLVWDAPHNLVWKTSGGWVHRKGAPPAGGADHVQGGPLEPVGGEPVLVPGAMGAPSWVLVGHGSPITIGSACHGAGRAVPRGKARHDLNAARQFLDRFAVITPVDPADLRGRQDITERWLGSIAEEAPWQYKDVGPVVGTLEAADVAHRAVRLNPLATIKA